MLNLMSGVNNANGRATSGRIIADMFELANKYAYPSASQSRSVHPSNPVPMMLATAKVEPFSHEKTPPIIQIIEQDEHYAVSMQILLKYQFEFKIIHLFLLRILYLVPHRQLLPRKSNASVVIPRTLKNQHQWFRRPTNQLQRNQKLLLAWIAPVATEITPTWIPCLLIFARFIPTTVKVQDCYS